MTADISVFELFMQASLFVKLVMLTLAMMSVLSWAIIFQRTIILSRAKKEALAFEDKFWSGIDLIQLYNEVKDHHVSLTGVEKIFYVGSTEFGRLRGNEKVTANSILEGTGRSMRVAVSQEVEALENHLPFLATVGSVSPYIGLLGTVWGIMHAFIALGEVKQATLSMVAPSISEALIATAVGLFAAIPAVVAYNRFSHQVSRLEHLYATFSEEFHGILHRQVVVRRD